MKPINFAVVGAGGFLGAIARYGISRVGSGEYAFLLTFGINLVGCFCLTFILTCIVRGAKIGEKARLFLTTGFLGAFTTFSTFSLELFNLWRAGNPFLALLYAGASIAGGILAAWLGFSATRLIFRNK